MFTATTRVCNVFVFFLQTETRSCYRESEKRPLTQRQHGGTEYTVSQHKLSLAESQGQDVTVVVTTGAYMSYISSYQNWIWLK